MNKTITALASSLALVAAASAQAADPVVADGKITFTGKVMATSCVIDIGGNGANGAVTLPSVPAKQLANAGDRHGSAAFTIQIGTDTDKCAEKNVQAFFFNKGQVNTDGRLDNSGTAGEIDVVLKNSQGQDINLTNNTNSEVVAVNGVTGTAEIDFTGEYYATGKATAGTVTTEVEYAIVYP